MPPATVLDFASVEDQKGGGERLHHGGGGFAGARFPAKIREGAHWGRCPRGTPPAGRLPASRVHDVIPFLSARSAEGPPLRLDDGAIARTDRQRPAFTTHRGFQRPPRTEPAVNHRPFDARSEE